MAAQVQMCREVHVSHLLAVDLHFCMSVVRIRFSLFATCSKSYDDAIEDKPDSGKGKKRGKLCWCCAARPNEDDGRRTRKRPEQGFGNVALAAEVRANQEEVRNESSKRAPEPEPEPEMEDNGGASSSWTRTLTV